jgi:uncharacterized integral membrane protein
MKKFKIVLWVIIVAFILTVFFENKDFFLKTQGIDLNLYFKNYQSPALPHIVWFLITLIIGLLVSYFFGLTERFKLKKTIKSLKTKIDTQMDMITQIRSELESRTGYSKEERPAVPADDLRTASEASAVKNSSNS